MQCTICGRGMNLSLILGGLWVIAATLVALLPMRLQMLPGLGLLLAAPVLLVWIGWEHGWTWAVFGLFAFVSMFRHPLRYVLFKALGRPAPRQRELRK